MRYGFLFIFLMLSLSACTFQVDLLTPEPSMGSELSTATPPPFEDSTSTPYPPGSETLTATPPPLPALTNIPTFTSSPISQIGDTYPIRFAPNGTYVDVVDTILAGTSKTYSINALVGQVMSISVHQSDAGNWTVVPIKIVGADGTTLCPQQENRECYFWHGTLPASQDYFVTLTPVIDVQDFTMRVAIDPPGTTSQLFQYESENQSVSFSYPDDFAPVRFTEMHVYKFEPELTLQFIDTKSHTDKNLMEADFLFGASSDTNMVENCFQPPAWVQNEQVTGDVNINGTQFTRSERGGVATGNIYERVIYRAVNMGVCYEISFLIHYVDVGLFPPELGIQEFDRAALLQRFESILSTLVIK